MANHTENKDIKPITYVCVYMQYNAVLHYWKCICFGLSNRDNSKQYT